ncbi:MAG: DNA repair protein [Alphaproteobacteria bacterium BRH_c36]|nr:MAG: DNA repair protein [Alphaproteobacteria bacterium BRH_c36]
MAKKHRAYWKGYLRLSLVTIGVEVYNAVESKSDISFRQIHKPTGRRVQYQKVVQGIGEIENSDIIKGYEVDTDTYVTIEPEEIDSLKLESKKTIDLVQFVDSAELDYRYFERPYFVAPADPLAGEGFVVIRDSLRKTGKVGLAQVTIGGREWLVAIAPVEDGLIMEMLRYAYELREPQDFFEDVPHEKPQKGMVDLAVQLIEQKSAPFNPEAFTDRYQDALKSLVQQKMKGKKVVAPDEEGRPSGANVIDLMEALKKSVEQSPAKAARSSKASSSKPTKGPSPSSNRSKKKA